jgi:hypothetical protein
MPCGGHATVGSTAQFLSVCVPLPDLVRFLERHGYSLRAWLQAAGLVPVCSTRILYVIAGCSNAIYTIGTVKAFRALEAIFCHFD